MGGLKSRSGQSTVEYIVVLTALLMLLGMSRGVFHELGETLVHKYRSYLFGISISEPPRRAIHPGGGTTTELSRMGEEMRRSRPPLPRLLEPITENGTFHRKYPSTEKR